MEKQFLQGEMVSVLGPKNEISSEGHHAHLTTLWTLVTGRGLHSLLALLHHPRSHYWLCARLATMPTSPREPSPLTCNTATQACRHS